MVTDIAGTVEFVMRLFVPPVPVIATWKVVVELTVPESVQVVVPVPAAARLTEVGLQTDVTPAGVEVKPMATAPAKPLLAGTLSRLVSVTRTFFDPPEAKLTVVMLETMLKPST